MIGRASCVLSPPAGAHQPRERRPATPYVGVHSWTGPGLPDGYRHSLTHSLARADCEDGHPYMCRNGAGTKTNAEETCNAKSAGSFLGIKRTRLCKKGNTGIGLKQAEKTCRELFYKPSSAMLD